MGSIYPNVTNLVLNFLVWFEFQFIFFKKRTNETNKK